MKIIGICNNKGGKICLAFNMNRHQNARGVQGSRFAGEKPDIAALRDLLNFAVNRVSLYAVGGRKVRIIDDNVINISFDI